MSKEDATLEYHAAVVYDSYHDVRKGYDQDVKSASVPPLSAAEKESSYHQWNVEAYKEKCLYTGQARDFQEDI
ncbi:MAG: hypothetical protein HXS41_12500 [Theionarchaea archaeon]|nr:hypothetical protein [Theionarchaea archaeon]MBU7021873.1 hypothetical protein [Theionarchaea archaeon]MBU7034324.1 hypothetical protein [Theionarchaea archaeon]